MGTALSFGLDSKMQNSVFRNVSNLGLCCNSFVLNINFKSK